MVAGKDGFLQKIWRDFEKKVCLGPVHFVFKVSLIVVKKEGSHPFTMKHNRAPACRYVVLSVCIAGISDLTSTGCSLL